MFGLSSLSLFFFCSKAFVFAVDSPINLNAYHGLLHSDLFEYPKFNFTEHINTEADINNYIRDLGQTNYGSKDLFVSGQKDDIEREQIPTTYSPLMLKAEKDPTKSLFCLVPKVEIDENELEEPIADLLESERREIILSGMNLLKEFDGECILYHRDWWTYKYCHNRMIKQYHEASEAELQGKAPFAQLEYFLGVYKNREKITLPGQSGENGLDSNDDKDKDLSTEVRNLFITTNIVRGNRRWYLSQTWSGGTECDITGLPRKTEVQFHCSHIPKTEIFQVSEVKACEYTIIIHTPLLCKYSAFVNSNEDDIFNVKCFKTWDDSLENEETSFKAQVIPRFEELKNFKDQVSSKLSEYAQLILKKLTSKIQTENAKLPNIKQDEKGKEFYIEQDGIKIPVVLKTVSVPVKKEESTNQFLNDEELKHQKKQKIKQRIEKMIMDALGSTSKDGSDKSTEKKDDSKEKAKPDDKLDLDMIKQALGKFLDSGADGVDGIDVFRVDIPFEKDDHDPLNNDP
ncbi:hypothetical protein BB560_001424 [Smittium megazygosporum]|uniref:Protein OS-9 homolog n=1 Tax=Smittium megazygosporum TaxID=133381 RepID=A0A2T9ZHM6_9FUNG|nr:hypothetical protein BB560_001424 [Smittium megazygosporum]